MGETRLLDDADDGVFFNGDGDGDDEDDVFFFSGGGGGDVST